MFEKQVLATSSESLALVEPAPTITDAERALQLVQQHEGYSQWKIIFPGTVILSAQLADLYDLAAGRPVPLQDMVRLYHAEDRGKLLSLIAQTLQDRRGFRCRLRVEGRDGQLRMVETIADLRVRDGRVTELFGLSRDVTAEMEAELRIEGRMQLVQDMVGTLPAPIAIVDARMRVMDCSVHWLKAHRFMERREVVGKTLQQLFPDMPQDQLSEYEAALKGQTIKTRRTFTSPSTGAPVQFATVIAPWFIADRKVGGFTLTIGWSEIATVKGTAPDTEVMEGFEGGLLDMLKQVV